jgi:hypothetical protein
MTQEQFTLLEKAFQELCSCLSEELDWPGSERVGHILWQYQQEKAKQSHTLAKAKQDE